MADASRPYKGPDKRQKKEYQCNECKDWFKQKDVSVDHIIPVGPLRSFEDLPDFYRRLFVGPDKLQALCKDCHNRKTQAERTKGEINDDDAE
jgi:5-methylcytosine-specific restriction endonuclease McrA